MSLDTLHFEAGVPHYAAKLQKAMNKFMLKLTPDKPVERNNVCSISVLSHWLKAYPSNKYDSSLSNWTTDFTGPTVWAINKEQRLPVRFQFPPSMH
jgi:hypothetical protein